MKRIIIVLLLCPMVMIAMERAPTPYKLLSVNATLHEKKCSNTSVDLGHSYTLTGTRLHSPYPNSPSNNAGMHTDNYEATLSLHGLEQNNVILGYQIFTKDNISIYTQQRIALALCQSSDTSGRYGETFETIKCQGNTLHLTIRATLEIKKLIIMK